MRAILFGGALPLLPLLLLGCAVDPQSGSQEFVLKRVDPEGTTERCAEATLLRDALNRRQWSRAVELTDWLARLDVPVSDGGGSFWTPGELALRVLNPVPREFLEEYRRRFDETARRYVRAGVTIGTFDRYFFCTGMDVAGSRLAARLYDEGRPFEAFRIWSGLFHYYPDSTLQREVLLARMMLAAAAMGDDVLLSRLPAFRGSISAGGRICDLDTLRRNLSGQLSPQPVTFVPVRHSGPFAPGLSIRHWVTDRGSVLKWRAVLRKGSQDILLTTMTIALDHWGAGKEGTTGLITQAVRAFDALDLVMVTSRERIFWSCRGDEEEEVAGLVALRPLRVLWRGPLRKAPVSPHWVDRLERAAKERD